MAQPDQIKVQCERAARMVSQVQPTRQVQIIKQAHGQGGQPVTAQRQGRQTVLPVEEIPVQGGDPVVIQRQGRQVAQPVEDARGQGGDLIVIQRQGRQIAQPVEDARGQGGQPVAVQRQVSQVAQPVEDARGQGGQPVAVQRQGEQPAQPHKVLTPEGRDAPVVQVQNGDTGQVCPGDIRAVEHAGNQPQQGRDHRRRAGTDGKLLDREGKRNAGGVAILIGDRPGVDAPRGDPARRAGQRARGEIHGQPVG